MQNPDIAIPAEEASVAPPADRGTVRARLADLFDEVGPRVYRCLLVVLGDAHAAEDALQAVFVELARRPELLDRMDSPTAYLLSAARRAGLRSLQSARRRREVEEAAARLRIEQRDETAARADGADPVEADAAETDRLRDALAALPEGQRQAVVLKALEGLTFQEIADGLEISINTAASRYRYGIEKLRSLLGGRGT